jgi:formylmethanofuran dehydrogenase subunit E
MHMDDKNEMWERAVRFHGHICPGLMIGFSASLYAMELLDLEFSEDEEVVCIVENDSCSVDAIQSVLGCTVGKGNLLFHMRGKQAFSFYNRNTGKSVRLVQKNSEYERTRDEAFRLKMMMDAKDMSGMLYDEFEEINGGLLCRQLRGDMMLTCAKYVTDVIGILEKLFEC